MLIAEYGYDTDIAVQREEAGRIAFANGSYRIPFNPLTEYAY